MIKSCVICFFLQHVLYFPHLKPLIKIKKRVHLSVLYIYGIFLVVLTDVEPILRGTKHSIKMLLLLFF